MSLDDLDSKTLSSPTPLAKSTPSASTTSLSDIQRVMVKLSTSATLSSEEDDDSFDDDTLNSTSPEEQDEDSSVCSADENKFFNTSLLAAKLNASSASLASLAGVTIPSHKQFGALIHKHEVPRKVFHSSIGFLTLWLYTQGVVLTQVNPVLITLFVVITATDFMRFRNAALNKLYCQILGPLMREKEVNTYNGVIWYLLGLVIVFSAFSKDIALLAVLLLSWADTAASTFGRAFGHLTPKFGRKSLAGSMASFTTGVISAVLLYKHFIPAYSHLNQPGDIMWTPQTSNIQFPLLVLLSGLVGAVSEAIDVFDIDDNFTIPVLSACFMWGVLTLGKK